MISFFIFSQVIVSSFVHRCCSVRDFKILTKNKKRIKRNLLVFFEKIVAFINIEICRSEFQKRKKYALQNVCEHSIDE